MNDKSIIKDLFNHMQWADTEVWKVVINNLNKTEKDVKIKTLLCHIHMTQYAFLKLWKNESLILPKEEDFKNLNEVSIWGMETNKSINKYFESLAENKLDKIVDIPWAKHFTKQLGKKLEDATCFDTMLQVAMHSTHHRGQLAKKLKELDCIPPMVDYIFWIWLGKPKTDWQVK